MRSVMDWAYLSALRCKHAIKEVSRWRSQNHDPGEPVKVFYGLDRLPPRNECAAGGIIKCQDLESRFPNTPHNANLLYLVSSALPVTPVLMARLAKRAGAKVVINQNGVAYPAWHGPGWARTNAPMRSLLELADFVVYQSKFCKESADKWVYKRDAPHEILYNAVDTSVFVPSAGRQSQAPFSLLITGSHHSWERIDTALQTLKELRDRDLNFVLIVAGRLAWSRDVDSMDAQFRSRCMELNIHEFVDLRGPYTQEEAVDLYHDADILLHTKYNDPCPRVVLEAMAAGIPVVHSASGGVPELVGDTGYGVPSPRQWDVLKWPTPSELADGAMAVASRYSELSAAARQRCVQLFGVDRWVQRHVEIFEALM